jgi:hypothetical protein
MGRLKILIAIVGILVTAHFSLPGGAAGLD